MSSATEFILVAFFVVCQTTAYDRRMSDWSYYVCSSDLAEPSAQRANRFGRHVAFARAQLLPQGATLAVVGKAEQIVLRPAEQRRDEQAREVEVVERLDREAHRREQVLHRERLRQRKAVDPRDGHVPRLQPRDDPRRKEIGRAHV